VLSTPDHEEAAMSTVHDTTTQVTTDGTPLRLALRLDAVASGTMGVGLIAGHRLHDDVLGMPAAVAVPVGVFLVAFAIWLGILASRTPLGGRAVWAVIVVNALWVVDSVVLVVAGLLPLTTAGVAVVLAQAIAVAVFADLEYLGLRRLAGSRSS
jgi:hypothetical protein